MPPVPNSPLECCLEPVVTLHWGKLTDRSVWNKMHRFKFNLLVFFAAALSLGLSACTSKAGQPAAQPPAPMVEVTQTALGTADIYSDYPAQTYARDLVEVRGRVEGYIEKWLFRPGQEVKAGEALYVLDLRPYQAQVNQAQGNLRQTEADLSFAQRQVSLLQAQANLASAQSNLVKAQQD